LSPSQINLHFRFVRVKLSSLPFSELVIKIFRIINPFLSERKQFYYTTVYSGSKPKMIRFEPPAEKEEDSYYEELRNSPVKEMDLEEDETAATAPACSVQKEEIVAKPQTLALVLYQPPVLLLLPAASEPKTECVPESASSSSAPESGNCLAEAPAPKAQPVAQLSATSSRKNTPTTDCFF
jgi:hypothetical protein